MRTTVTEAKETLSSLVRSQVGPEGEMTYNAFLDRAVDPETGYRPSISIVQRLAKSQPVKINPALVRAIAAGLKGVSLRRAQEATFREYIGELPDEADVVVTAASSDGVSISSEDTPLTVGEFRRFMKEIGQPVSEHNGGDSNEA